MDSSFTSSAFNSQLLEFIEELSKAFPNNQELKMCLLALPNILEAKPETGMQFFTQAYAPHAAKITNKDPSLFTDVPKLCGYVDVLSIWQQADQGTRDVIWAYISTLWCLASTLGAMPPELLSGIEQLAHDYASKLESGEVDLSQLMGAVPQLMNQLNFFTKH